MFGRSSAIMKQKKIKEKESHEANKDMGKNQDK
jgi:hypothetical protein